MTEASVGISVFPEDKASYDSAMARCRTRTAAYVSGDGPARPAEAELGLIRTHRSQRRRGPATGPRRRWIKR